MLDKKIFLFFLAIQLSIISNAWSDKRDTPLRLLIGDLGGNNYSLTFCVHKKDFIGYDIMDPFITYGGALKKDIQVFLRKESVDGYEQFGFVYNGSVLDSDKNIYIRVPFLSLKRNEIEFTYYYELKEIVSKMHAEIVKGEVGCELAVLVEPTRVGGKRFDLIM